MTTITNLNARVAHAAVENSQSRLADSSKALVTGKANTNVADDSVSSVLRNRTNVLKVAQQTVAQADSLLKTALSSVQNVQDLLEQQKRLSAKSADDSLTSNERGFLNQEFQVLSTEINRIAANANFNGKKLLDGSISGKAGISTSTSETIQNYSVVAGTDFKLAGTLGSGPLATSPFGITAGNSVGITRAEGVLTFDQAAAGGNSSVTINGEVISFVAVANDDAATAAAFVAEAKKATGGADAFIYTDNGDGTVAIKANDYGTGANTLVFTTTVGTNLTISLGATDVNAGTTLTAAGQTLGTNRAVSTNDATFNTSLLGKISNITANVTKNDGRLSVTLTADVNGKTYTSNDFYLIDDGNNDSAIRSGQVITFFDPNGPIDSNTGSLSDNAFTLTIGSNDIVIADGAFSASTAQDSLNDFASNLENQLANNVVTQDRNPALETVSTTNFDIKGAIGTFLAGIKGYDSTNNTKGDIVLRSDGFGSTGTHGSIGAFSFDRATGILKTSIDGVEYSADLTSTTDTTATTGKGYLSGGTAFSTSTGLFTTTGGTIVLATADPKDGRQLRIDLGNVDNAISSVSVTSAEAETAFEDAFNKTFGVSANESLSFQVGVVASDSIGVSIQGAKTTDLHKNAQGVAVTLDITTLKNAQTAGDVLDLAINKAISLKADIKASISSFNSAKANNQSSIQNAEAAASRLSDTDYSTESTNFAEAKVIGSAASAILAQLNSMPQEILQLLRQ